MIEKMILFILFVLCQAVAINGIFECFQKGQIFYLMMPDFIERNKEKKWIKPLWGCVRCMSSVWGSIIFWGTVLPIYGFYPIEIWICIWNIIILSVVNIQVYKKL